MPYSANDLWHEAVEIIDGALSQGQTIAPDWITNAIVAAHPLPDDFEGDDAEYTEICRWSHTRDVVRKAVGRFKANPKLEIDDQLTMPGWEHLQKGYLVTRDGEQQLVPVSHLRPMELERKAKEYEQMGRGCFAHAQEIRRYVRMLQEQDEAMKVFA
jgi:hypothetical protein